MGELLRPYEHIQNLNISKNEVEDISCITAFNYLLVLDASTNQIGSIGFLENSPDGLQFLQVSDLFPSFTPYLQSKGMYVNL